MSHYHPAYYQTEARVRQAAKVDEARRWSMTRQAAAPNQAPARKTTSFLDRLRARLSGTGREQRTRIPTAH